VFRWSLHRGHQREQLVRHVHAALPVLVQSRDRLLDELGAYLERDDPEHARHNGDVLAAILKSRVWLSGVLAFLVPAMGGCGDGQGLSRDQYIAKLNAMCEDFSAREQEIGAPQSLSDLVEKGPRILEAFEDAILDEVDGLEAPDEIAAEANRLADLADEQRNVLGELVKAAGDSDLLAARLPRRTWRSTTSRTRLHASSAPSRALTVSDLLRCGAHA
jgi:hypothetical protein